MSIGPAIEILRTRRKKTVFIQIVNGAVRVLVPWHLSRARVDALLQARQAWIAQKLREQALVVPPAPRVYASGERFPYLGKTYRLKFLPQGEPPVKLLRGCLELALPPKSPPEAIRTALETWYFQCAKLRLKAKTQHYAEIVGRSPKEIRVRDYKSRWGSCSPKGVIAYNWRLIMAPPAVLDYVVVHELCHLKHLNHSPAYWETVRHVLPNFALPRQWLKNHGQNLFL